LDDGVERLQAAEERIEQAEQIEAQLERAREVLGVDVQETAGGGDADERVEQLEERIADLEAENERLREHSNDAVTLSFPTVRQGRRRGDRPGGRPGRLRHHRRAARRLDDVGRLKGGHDAGDDGRP